jgi:hypothetical protein
VLLSSGTAAVALPASIDFSAATGGLADLQHASIGVAPSQSTIGGAATSQGTIEGVGTSQATIGAAATPKPTLTDREFQVIAPAIETQKQFLARIRQSQGSSEYSPSLNEFMNEFMRATETNYERLERKAKRAKKQKEATSARRRSADAELQYQQATVQATEAKACIDAAKEEAQRIEQELVAMGDVSSRDLSSEPASSVRSRSSPRGS